MQEGEPKYPRLILVDDHPFSRRQRQIIQLMLNGVTKTDDIAEEFKTSPGTVRNQVAGTKDRPGIFQKIEEYTGKRPGDRTEAIWMLFEHGTIIRESGPNGREDI